MNLVQPYRVPTIQELEHARDDVAAGALNLVFILRDPPKKGEQKRGPCRPMHIQMTKAVADELRKTFAKYLRRIIEVPNLEIKPFQIGGEVGGELPAEESKVESLSLESIPCDRVPALKELIPAVGDGSVPRLPVLEKIEKPDLKALWAYMVIVSHDGSQVSYYRRFKPSMVIRADGWLRFTYHKGMLTTIQEDIFNFDQEADAMVIGENALVLHRAYFEEIFDLVHEVYEPMAKKAVEGLRMAAVLSDPDALLEACKTDNRKLRKLATFPGTLDISKLTWDNVLEVKSRWNVALDLDDTLKQVTVTPGTVWNILRLLDDDYLRSDVTDNLYEVLGEKHYVGRWTASASKRRRRRVPKPKAGPVRPSSSLLSIR